MTTLTFTLAAGLVLATSTTAAALVADSADDVCMGDPCIVSEEIEVIDGSTLDFGNRALIVESGGSFQFGNGSATILCGSFQSEGSKSIVSAGKIEQFSLDQAHIIIRAQRRCSGASTLGCVDPDDCGTGTCSARRCAEKPSHTCTTDTDCNLGQCGFSGCTGDYTQPCHTDADCDFGACAAALTCSNRSDDPIACVADGECDLGTCSVGSAASITMGGAIRAAADFPGSIVLQAADSISVSGKVDLSGKTPESDGGDLSLYAAAGDVTLSSRIRQQGGAHASGGNLAIESGRDVFITKGISLDGGLWNGGRLHAVAARDTSITGSLSSRGKTIYGSGGWLTFETGRDLALGGERGVRVLLSGSGSNGAGGYGGYLDLDAGGDVTVASKVRLVANGGPPDGTGGSLGIDAGGDVIFDGRMTSLTPGYDGRAGTLYSSSGGTTTFGASSKLTFSGSSDGGFMSIQSTGDLVFAGTAGLTGATVHAGDVDMTSAANATISGTIRSTGYVARNSYTIQVEACRVNVAETALLRNDSRGGATRIRAHESMRLLAGSTLVSDVFGSNTLEYRTAAKPPVVAGTATPAPTLVLNEALTGCPVCGNSEIDQGETCDDGNTAPGDGCDASCQSE